MKKSTRNIMAVLSAMAVMVAPFAQSATYYWDTDGDILGGFGNTAGTWGTSAFWSGDDTGASATANTAITTADGIHFGTASLALGPLAANVGVDAAGVTVNSITFGSAQTPAVVLGTAGSTITLGGTTPTITVNNAADTISSILAGTSLTKAGTGTLTLTSTNNTYTGETTISGGVLKLTSISGEGPAVLTNAVLRIDASTLASGTYTSVANLGTRGGSFSASSGNVPVGSANANANIKGRNAFFFDGANALISATAYANTGNAMTIFTVASSKATGANVNYLGYLSLVRTTSAADWNDNSSSVAALTADSVGNSFGQYRANGPIAGVGASMPQGYANAFITEQTFNGTTSTFALTGTNGVTATAANVASTGNFNITNTAIGGRYGNPLGSYWKGDVGEVLIFNSALSPADIATIRNYLVYKWFGLGSPASSDNPLPISTAVSIASGATFDLNGTSQTIASLSDSFGSGGTVTNSAAYTTSLTLNPSSGSTTFSGALSGPIRLVKSGVATQVLAGASTYTGGTTINSGMLLVNGSINSAVSVASGAYLGGTGAITGNVTFAAGALALFTDSAPLTFTGPVTLNNNTVHLTLSDNLADGTYLLATNTTSSFSGTFAAAPFIANGSTLGAYRTITMSSSAVRLIVATTDTTAPTPNPMTFAVNPLALDASTVVMTATTATDLLSSPVQYYFTNTVNGNTSGWVSGTVWTNSGLTKGVTYGYQVKARDAAVPPNETGFSSVFTAVPAEPTILWDANKTSLGQTDGAGTWLDANQWWDGSANVSWNNSIPNNAVIGNGGGGGTITLGSVTAGSVVLTNFTGTYTLTGGSLTQSGGVTIAPTSDNVAIGTAIGGAGGLTKAGTGTLTLSGGNSYSGGTTINVGTVTVGNTAALGASAGAVSVASGAVLNLNGISPANANALTLNGSGIGGTGALLNSSTSADSVYKGVVTLGSDSTIGNMNSARVMRITDGVNSTINTGGFTLTFKGAGTVNIPRGTGISGSGSVVVDGLLLNLITGGTQSANSYTGTTTVVNGGGIMYYANNIGTGNINLAGGTLEGYYNEGFTRPFGAAPGQFQITGGVSGFGVNGSHTINFSNVSEVKWGVDTFNPSKFVLGGGFTGGTSTFAEGIDLYGADRTVTTPVGGGLSGLIRNTSGTAAGLIKEGGGTLTLSFNNTFNGPVTVSQGTLSISSINNVASANPLGQSSAAAANLLLANGTTLKYTGGAATCDRSFTINGTAAGDSASLDASGTGALVFKGTASPAYGTPNQSRKLILTGTSTYTNTLAASIANNGSGAVAVTKTGAGTWVLTGNSSFSGNTIVTNGILRITGKNVLSPLTSVHLSTGSITGKVDLAFNGTQRIAALYINGVKQSIGTPVGANNVTITGSGFLSSGSGTLISFR